MALKLNNGKYVKLDLNGCYIDVRGIHVAYFIYDNVDIRDAEQTANSKLRLLLNNISNYIEEKTAILQENIGDINEITSKEELLDRMTAEDKKIYDEIHSIEEDRQLILVGSQIGDNSIEGKLSNLKLLKELGYSKEILNGTMRGYPASNISGVFTGQKLNYTEMYKELKKIFKKEGYEDC